MLLLTLLRDLAHCSLQLQPPAIILRVTPNRPSTRAYVSAIIKKGFGSAGSLQQTAADPTPPSTPSISIADVSSAVEVTILDGAGKKSVLLDGASATAGSKMSAVHAAQKWLTHAENGVASCS